MQHSRRSLLLDGEARLGAARGGWHGEDRDHRCRTEFGEGHRECHAERDRTYCTKGEISWDTGKRQMGGTCHLACHWRDRGSKRNDESKAVIDQFRSLWRRLV